MPEIVFRSKEYRGNLFRTGKVNYTAKLPDMEKGRENDD